MPATVTSRLALLATLTVSLLLVALPALAAEGTSPIEGEHDGVIGSAGALGMAAVVGILLGVLTFAMLPARPVDDHDEH